jgi:hypothetical protein
MDSLIRNHIKDVLHLPTSTPNGFLYYAKCDGRLGIHKREIMTTLKQGITMINNTDPPTLQALFMYS